MMLMYLLIISLLFVVAVTSLFYLNVFINHFSLFVVVAVVSQFYVKSEQFIVCLLFFVCFIFCFCCSVFCRDK